MDERGRLVAEEERSWNELWALVERLGPEEMDVPGVTPEGWTVKDTLWHIGWWAAEAARQLERIRLGTYQDEDSDTEDLNQRIWEEGRDLDLATVRAEALSARTRALQELQAIAEITPPVVEWFGESGAEHYDEHIRDLRAFAETRGAGA